MIFNDNLTTLIKRNWKSTYKVEILNTPTYLKKNLFKYAISKFIISVKKKSKFIILKRNVYPLQKIRRSLSCKTKL
jgi:hypothetical protein